MTAFLVIVIVLALLLLAWFLVGLWRLDERRPKGRHRG